MIRKILTGDITGISEFKKNPLTALDHSQDEAITVLHNNKPAFCCITIQKYEELLGLKDQIEQYKLLLVKASYREALEQDRKGTLIDSDQFFDELLSGKLEQ